MPQRYKFIVLTNAVDDRDDEFNDWYSNVHLSDVTGIPGIVSAERYKLAHVQRNPQQPFRYLAIYEIETDDLEFVTAEIGRRAGTPAMVISDAMAADKIAAIFTPL
ncbi:MAG: hypothetical protein KF849_00500 [Rhizobiaceae bacterium]|nr:hypothetical protein [Rhizobiaceae bacterium]